MDQAITTSGNLLARPANEQPRPVGFTGNPVVAIATAALVVLCLFWSSAREPLPALGWAAAFLCVAIYFDVTRLRIPNWLTLPSLVAALAAAGIMSGVQALIAAFLGAITALGILFLPFTLGWMGAGDVKATIVLGVLWGAADLACALWWMIVAGGLLALVTITIRGGLGQLLRRWFDSACMSARCGRIVYISAPTGSAARSGLPFAVAMGFGAAAYQLWGAPWM